MRAQMGTLPFSSISLGGQYISVSRLNVIMSGADNDSSSGRVRERQPLSVAANKHYSWLLPCAAVQSF
jgi:hypothetical protein